jgi:hypothetical protein
MGLLRHHPSIGKLRFATGAQRRYLARERADGGHDHNRTIPLAIMRGCQRALMSPNPTSPDKFDGRGPSGAGIGMSLVR